MENQNKHVSELLSSHSVVPDSLWPCGLQHAGLFCPSLSIWVCSNLCALSQWCYVTILSSVTHFSFCLQSFPTSGSFLMSQFFASGGQSIRASASASILPVNIECWFPLGLSGLISLLSKRLSRVISSTIRKHQFFGVQPSLWSNCHIHTWLLKKIIALTRQTFVSKVTFLLFNTLFRFVIAFLPRNKHLLILKI